MSCHFDKDPNSTKDYEMDWSSWLPSDDSISSSTWIVPDGLTNENEEYSATATKIWLSGGVLGNVYAVTNRITTSAGRIEDYTMYITIKEG